MKKKLLNILGVASAIVAVSACNLDVNKDPYAVTTLDETQLLTATEYEVGATFTEGYYLNANFSAYVHHTVSREVDNYSIVPSYSTLTNTWAQAYRYAIKNCDKLVEVGKEKQDTRYLAAGKILGSYVYMNIVDLWGNVPFSEANKSGIQTPKADESSSIYNEILKSINEAIAALKSTDSPNPLTFGANDLLYSGNTDKWLKAANTLKLKLLTQSRKASAKITNYDSELSALIAEDNFLADGEDLQFPHSTTKTPSDERKAGFVDEYEGTQKGVYISPWLYEVMKGKTYNFKDNPFKNIVDPRCEYYWYNQLGASDAASNPTDYRDAGFVSIIMASNSGYTSSSQDAAMSVIGIYPVGGKFDDGSAKAITKDSGSGAAPDKMLQAYSVPFMKAELALLGKITGDPAALLKAGILSSIKHVNTVSVAAGSAISVTVPEIAATDAEAFADQIVALFNAAGTDDKKLEILMTQKWIANFYNPIEAYNDIRRTGYPILFKGDENNLAWTNYKQQTAAEQGLTSFGLGTILAYPRILWYPQNEADANPNISNKGRVVSDANVFWDVK